GTPKTGNDTLDMIAGGATHTVTVDVNGVQIFNKLGGGTTTPASTDTIQLVEMQVIVTVSPERVSVYNELGAHPDQKRSIGKILQADDPEDENAVVYLQWDSSSVADPAINLMNGLRNLAATSWRLAGGNDGDVIGPDDLAGLDADPDKPELKAT